MSESEEYEKLYRAQVENIGTKVWLPLITGLLGGDEKLQDETPRKNSLARSREEAIGLATLFLGGDGAIGLAHIVGDSPNRPIIEDNATTILCDAAWDWAVEQYANHHKNLTPQAIAWQLSESLAFVKSLERPEGLAAEPVTKLMTVRLLESLQRSGERGGR